MHEKGERRYKKRFALSVKIGVCRIGKCGPHTLDAYLLETKDITQKGLFLKTAKVFPIGTKLRLTIEPTPDTPPVSVTGRVAWIAKKSQRSYYPGIGIEITDIAAPERKRLNNFLKEKFRNYHHAVELQKMYLRLKEMAARLYELEEYHRHAEHFRKVIDKAVNEINYIAHLLDREVWEVKRL